MANQGSIKDACVAFFRRLTAVTCPRLSSSADGTRGLVKLGSSFVDGNVDKSANYTGVPMK